MSNETKIKTPINEGEDMMFNAILLWFWIAVGVLGLVFHNDVAILVGSVCSTMVWGVREIKAVLEKRS